MIRINLLPHARAKKTRQQALLWYQILFSGGLVLLLLLVMGSVWFFLNSQIRHMQGQAVAFESRMQQLHHTMGEVQNYEQDKKVFEERIQVIQQLKINQTGPVRLLNQISHSLPVRVWLVSLKQNDRVVSLEGMSLTNTELVDFMDRLSQSGLFSDVQLLESRQESEKNVPVYKFRIHCTLAA